MSINIEIEIWQIMKELVRAPQPFTTDFNYNKEFIHLGSAEFEVEGTVLPGHPGNLSGPPEDCYPSDSTEVVDIQLVDPEKWDTFVYTYINKYMKQLMLDGHHKMEPPELRDYFISLCQVELNNALDGGDVADDLIQEYCDGQGI